MKPGLKTSEFWGKTIVQILAILAPMFGFEIDDQTSIAIVGGVEAAYNVGRGFAKRGHNGETK